MMHPLVYVRKGSDGLFWGYVLKTKVVTLRRGNTRCIRYLDYTDPRHKERWRNRGYTVNEQARGDFSFAMCVALARTFITHMGHTPAQGAAAAAQLVGFMHGLGQAAIAAYALEIENAITTNDET